MASCPSIEVDHDLAQTLGSCECGGEVAATVDVGMSKGVISEEGMAFTLKAESVTIVCQACGHTEVVVAPADGW
jgi:hypothetical protein